MTVPVILQGDGTPVVQQSPQTPVVVPDTGGGVSVVQTVETTVVVAVGIAGPPGPSGGGTYVHTQSIAATGWTVAHNLGKYPSVTVVDSLDNTVIADTAYIDTNIVQITHGTAMIGRAFCN